MGRQVALLRGINLGPHKRVSMAELRDLLTRLGYGDVRTHLQSGNVVLTSNVSAERLQRELEQQIEAGLGVDTSVVVRTRDELAGVVARDPLAGVVDDFARYQVSFLSAEPDPEWASQLAAVDVAPERFVLSGREIYAWHPDGVRRSRLAKLISEPRLGVTATARNWNTVTKLLELASE